MTHPNTVRRLQDVLDRLEAGGTYREVRGELIDIYNGLNGRMLMEREEELRAEIGLVQMGYSRYL